MHNVHSLAGILDLDDVMLDVVADKDVVSQHQDWEEFTDRGLTCSTHIVANNRIMMIVYVS